MKFKPGDIIEFKTESSNKKKVGVILNIHDGKYVIKHITNNNQYLIDKKDTTSRKKFI